MALRLCSDPVIFIRTWLAAVCQPSCYRLCHAEGPAAFILHCIICAAHRGQDRWSPLLSLTNWSLSRALNTQLGCKTGILRLIRCAVCRPHSGSDWSSQGQAPPSSAAPATNGLLRGGRRAAAAAGAGVTPRSSTARGGPPATTASSAERRARDRTPCWP